jgi:hypothetical protein
MNRWLATILVALALAGCVQPGQTPPVPSSEEIQYWRAQGGQGGGAGGGSSGM